jgi:hypothetical protein
MQVAYICCQKNSFIEFITTPVYYINTFAEPQDFSCQDSTKATGKK